MPKAAVPVGSPKSRRVQAWLDWSEDELWIAPSSRRSVSGEQPMRDRAARPAPPRLAQPASPRMTDSPSPTRRTVTITGHGDDRRTGRAQLDARPRPQRRAHERPGYQPDRTALYAVLLGVVLVLVAATSSHAAALRHAHAGPPARVSAAVATTVHRAAPAPR